LSKAKYTPLEYFDEDEVLDSPTALRQAAMALDVAAQLAVESRDTETLIAVSMGWTKLSESLGEEEEEEEEKDKEEKPQVGFSSGGMNGQASNGRDRSNSG